MSYDLILELITMMGEFEDSCQSEHRNLAHFSAWLSQRVTSAEEPVWPGKPEGLRPEEMIAILLRHVNRYGNFYIRKVLADTEFATLDDFLYLMSLIFVKPMPVKELIKRHIHEKPSGMEIIRRLHKKGMIEMDSNETDKRSKVIKITEKGRTAAFSSMQRLKQVNDVITGDLSSDEKLQLIHLLQKLDRFHNPLFIGHKNAGFDALYELAKGSKDAPAAT